MLGLSYIISTKNRADIINQTIDSLLKQTVRDWEAIIVDDHGQDQTEQVVKSYHDVRLKYLRIDKFKVSGASNARNYAVMNASAKFIAVLDSDDIAYPQRTEITLKTFSENKNADVFYANLDILEEESGVVRERKTPVIPFLLEEFKKRNFIPHSTIAIKREVLINNPYNPFFVIAEDYDLLSRLAIAGKKFIYSPQKLLLYRIWRENMTSPEHQKLINDYIQLVKMSRNWIPFDKKIFDRIRNNRGE